MRGFFSSVFVGAIMALPVTGNAKISVKPKIFIDGQPARHANVSVYNCKTGALETGPVAVAEDGSVELQDIDPGDHCLKAEISGGYASKEVQLDTNTAQQQIDLVEISPRLTVADRTIPVTLCLFTFLMVIYPIARYLAKPWTFRREYLIGQLSGESMKLYYERFRAGASIKGKAVGDASLSDADYTEAFREDFEKWYGRRYYIAPVLGLAIVTGICGWWGCVNLWDWTSGLRSLESMRGLVAAAIAGAFIWVISDEIDRLRRRDFTSYDVYYYVFRILVAVPFGWALTRLQLTLQVGIPVAFFLGAFPTSTLFTAARRLAKGGVVALDVDANALDRVSGEGRERVCLLHECFPVVLVKSGEDAGDLIVEAGEVGAHIQDFIVGVEDVLLSKLFPVPGGGVGRLRRLFESGEDRDRKRR